MIAKLPKAHIVYRRDVTEDLMVIKLKPEVDFTFKPGQYCTLGYGSVERAYSIVSAPHEDELEIFVELVPLPDGVLTPVMWGLGVGDQMSIRPRAKGIFTMDERYNNHLMVATVTGIAPFHQHDSQLPSERWPGTQVLRPPGRQLPGRVHLRRGDDRTGPGLP